MSQLLQYELKALLCIMYDFSPTTTHFHDSVLFDETLIYFRYILRAKTAGITYGNTGIAFFVMLEYIQRFWVYNFISDNQLRF